MKCLLLVLCFAACSEAFGHGTPAILADDAGQLVIAGVTPYGELEDDGFEVWSEDPALGVNFQAAGPPVGTVVSLETVGGLRYWNGAELVETEAVLTIEAPEFDSLGNANSTAIAEYQIEASSGALTGMTWHTYPGGDFWDAHGYFTLSESGGPPPGLYGAAVRLVDLSSTPLEPSDPFNLAMLFDPNGSLSVSQIEAGLAAFDALLATLPGDFNNDGLVDQSDYQTWSADYGDQFTAADYTIWRDAYESQPVSFSVPEPSAIVIALLLSINYPRFRN